MNTPVIPSQNAFPCHNALLDLIKDLPLTRAVVTNVLQKDGTISQVVTICSADFNPDDIEAGVKFGLRLDPNNHASKSHYYGLITGVPELFMSDSDVTLLTPMPLNEV